MFISKFLNPSSDGLHFVNSSAGLRPRRVSFHFTGQMKNASENCSREREGEKQETPTICSHLSVILEETGNESVFWLFINEKEFCPCHTDQKASPFFLISEQPVKFRFPIQSRREKRSVVVSSIHWTTHPDGNHEYEHMSIARNPNGSNLYLRYGMEWAMIVSRARHSRHVLILTFISSHSQGKEKRSLVRQSLL